MRIGLDAKRAFCNRTGLGNYSRNIIRALAENFPEDELVLFTPRISVGEFAEEIKKHPNVKIVLPSLPGFLHSWWRTYGIKKDIKRHGIDLFHGLSNELPSGISRTGARSAVTIHDLIPFKEVSFYNPLDRWIYGWKMKRSVREADAVIAISRQTAEDAQHFLSVSREKIHVIYQPVNPEFLAPVSPQKQQEVKQKYALPASYMLHVGRVELRKNLHSVLLAMTRMGERSGIHLVAVGRKTKFYRSLESYFTNYSLRNRVHFFDTVPSEDLPALYSLATCVIYPSLMEGFGLPVTEGLAAGVPVITSKGGCFEEAGSDVAFYVDPGSPEDIAEKILMVESSRGTLQDRINNGKIHIRQFSAQNVAVQLGKLYRNCLA